MTMFDEIVKRDHEHVSTFAEVCSVFHLFCEDVAGVDFPGDVFTDFLLSSLSHKISSHRNT